MRLIYIVLIFFIFHLNFIAQQLAVARDTISVLENGKVLKMPWADGINYSNVSNMDVNFDGKKDLIVYDRINHISTGRFRVFIKTGNAGQATYTANPDLSYFFPTVFNWAVFFDYNCDGKEDLFCSTNSGIKVYVNQSSVANPINFVLVKNILISNYNPGGQPLLGNIYASSVGVPGISDLDNDGDLDILTFSSQGVYIEYHKNLSKELYGNCDSLVYELAEGCWGKMAESSCSIDLNQCSPKTPQNKTIYYNQSKTLHAGSCLTCIDSDGDRDKDLVMGDIFCNKLQYAHNTGDSANALITDTTILYPNYPLKNNTLQVKLNNFPCGYNVDVDGDNKKDLVASPSAFGSENFRSVWYYRNTSATNTVNFQFVKKNLLQDEMIEVGQNSFPIMLDYNLDGKKDLLIGNYAYSVNDTLKSQLTLYQNTGSLSQPSYSLITRNYANLSTYALNHLMPTAGDIDNDGDIDLLLGTSSGQIHWLVNSAGAGNTCNFSSLLLNPFAFTTISAEAAPQLFDIDQDGMLDLLIGMKNGRLAYYRNVGTAAVPSFSLISNTFGNVDVRDNISIYGIDGYAVPFFYKDGFDTKLLIGSISGNLFYYTVPANLSQNFNLVNSHVNNYNEGAQSSLCFEDVNNDGKRDLFIGNAAGGISFFSSNSPNVSVAEIEKTDLEKLFDLYPVPAKDVLQIKVNEIEFTKARIEIKNLLGNSVRTVEFTENSQSISLTGLEDGVYLAQFNVMIDEQNYVLIKKFFKQE